MSAQAQSPSKLVAAPLPAATLVEGGAVHVEAAVRRACARICSVSRLYTAFLVKVECKKGVGDLVGLLK